MKTPEEKKAENNTGFIEDSDWDDDSEIQSTLRSAHQAEWLFGYHGYASGGYRGANENKDYGQYVKGLGYSNGTNPWITNNTRESEDWWENWLKEIHNDTGPKEHYHY